MVAAKIFLRVLPLRLWVGGRQNSAALLPLSIPVRAALAAGAFAFVEKRAMHTDLLPAVELACHELAA